VKKTASDVLQSLAPELSTALKAANGRLTQTLSASDVLFGVRKVADEGHGSCLLLQPGASGYQWSDRTVPIVFMAQVDGRVHVAVKRARAYRSGIASPSYWPELRAFPRGDAPMKLRAWAAVAEEKTCIARDIALTAPKGAIECHISEWQIKLRD
jgi:hypothetical protein